jgi:hypothetical protein
MILLVGNRLLRAKPSWRRFPPRRIISSSDRVVSSSSGDATPHRESPRRSLLVGCHSAWCDTRAPPLVSHHASWHPKHPHGTLRTPRSRIYSSYELNRRRQCDMEGLCKYNMCVALSRKYCWDIPKVLRMCIVAVQKYLPCVFKKYACVS